MSQPRRSSRKRGRKVIDTSSDEDRPETVPSPEILELQQKLAKSEKDKKRAIRMSGAANARVEFLEGLIDNKPAVGDDGEKKRADELQKTIGELTKDRVNLGRKLAAADKRGKRRAEELQEKIDELTNHRDELIRKLDVVDRRDKRFAEEQQERIVDLTIKLAVVDRKDKRQLEEQQDKIHELTNHRDDLIRKLNVVDRRDKRQLEEQEEKIEELAHNLSVADRKDKRLVEEQQEKIEELTRMLEVVDRKQKRLAEEQQERIDELTHKLTVAERSDKRLLEEQQEKIDELNQKMSVAERREKRLEKDLQDKVHVLSCQLAQYENGQQQDTTAIPPMNNNIFKVLPAGAPDSISFEIAFSELHGPWKYVVNRFGMADIIKRCEDLFKNEKLNCDVCKMRFTERGILGHFFSVTHEIKVRACKGAVSRVAFDYWKCKVQSIKDQSSAPVDPTVSAPTANDGTSSNEVDDVEM